MVITGLTRNQFVSNHTRVRIPPSAPRKDTFWGVLFFLGAEGEDSHPATQSQGSVVRRRAAAACERMARRDAFEQSESLPSPSAPKILPKNYGKVVLGSIFLYPIGENRLFIFTRDTICFLLYTRLREEFARACQSSLTVVSGAMVGAVSVLISVSS